jgi:zinc transporter, ZIP family
MASRFSVSVTNLVKGKRCPGGKCYGFSDHDCEQKCAIERQRVANQDDESASSSDAESIDASAALDGSGPHHHHYHHHSHPHAPAERSGHHHVSDNKFLSIGVQTSFAIALHKIPEASFPFVSTISLCLTFDQGFITYATNHANPQLGLAVFLAIFIHNIAEGFAMSLPLFLALKSRFWAVVWASLLGGLSQPLGAGLAALSMKDPENDLNNHKQAYGLLFAATGMFYSAQI